MSNDLNTIFTLAKIDTCNKRIIVSWNSYKSYPKQVSGYRILVSVNGGIFSEAGITGSSSNSLIISNFIANTTYCFETMAILDGGYTSSSNKTCHQTGMQRAPDWINADYATVDEKNNINLSFSVDPFSEISAFRLEKKTEDENDFSIIAQIESGNKQIRFTDKTADPLKKNYYRLLAINNCGNPIVSSNLSCNIVVKLEKNGNSIALTWNAYKLWMETVSGYKVHLNTGNGFHEESSIQPPDTEYSLNYSSVMYNITGAKLCFCVSAFERANPHDIAGETVSAGICTETIENITVPNAFTPNNDLTNDFFKPVLSFTPVDYHLVITDRQNNILFESRDYLAEWDGKKNGYSLPQGVYLWFLKVKTPSEKQITKSR